MRRSLICDVVSALEEWKIIHTFRAPRNTNRVLKSKLIDVLFILFWCRVGSRAELQKEERGTFFFADFQFS
jgi:hypothetical protein